MSKNGSKELQKSLKNQQRIEVGDLVYLGSDIESWYSRDFELGPFGDEQKIKLPDRREYYCSMIGKNGKVINMVFSENDLVIISKGVKLLNEEVLI